MSNRQLLPIRLAIFLLSLLLILHNGCSTEVSQEPRDKQEAAVSEAQQQKQEQPAAEAVEVQPKLSEPAKVAPPKSEQAAAVSETQQQKQETPVATAIEQPDTVARIGDYAITKKELEQKLMAKIRPYNYEQLDEQVETFDINEVLLEMVAEKAMIMEGRKQGYLQDEEIGIVIDRFKDRKLANMAWLKYIQGRKGALEVTEEEIDKQVKANPKLNQARAKLQLQRQKATQLFEQYYNQLCEKFHLKKESANFLKAAQIHDRLLSKPKTPRKQWWILTTQIREELIPEERDTVLATYDGGKITMKDWLYALMEMSPPSRPKDLNTEKGVETFLNRALRVPIFVAEAKSLGFDKDKDFLQELREREDMSLLGKTMSEKVKDVNEPTEAQIIAYFEKNKEKFGTPRTLRIDQIWCSDLETANKVKTELESGKDFEAAKTEYSLQKQGKPVNIYPGSEGIFFQDLWKGDPNQIVGPIKGFYSEGLKWRIVKILEKKPAEIKEYSADMKNRIKWRMMGEQKETILADYRKELLQKYPYKIYVDRIKDIDPLDIP
jgi:peptidyl-prolyl cis-trans isomerase C